MILGGRPGEAESVARSCRVVAERSGSEEGVAAMEVSLASSTFALGRPRTAMRWAADALAHITDAEMRRIALGVRGAAAAVVGEVTIATNIARELTAEPSPYLAVQSQVLRCTAWSYVVIGRTDEAVAQLLTAAAECRRVDARSGELAILHDVARLGQADAVVERVTALVDGMDGALPTTVQRFIRSVVDDDGVGLEDAARAFGRMGTALWEAEAWSLACGAHRRAGRTARAVACAASARTVGSACEGAATPALTIEDLTSLLTRREREIATLAAKGATDREIASALGVSIRTVQAHLSKVYAKLDVGGRSELGSHF